MGQRIDDVMKLCCELSANQQIKSTVKSSGKGAATAGGLAFAGGLIGGPLGIAVGKILAYEFLRRAVRPLNFPMGSIKIFLFIELNELDNLVSLQVVQWAVSLAAG